MNKESENECNRVREILRAALNTKEEDVVKLASGLVETLSSSRNAMSPVSDNPIEDDFYEKAEASARERYLQLKNLTCPWCGDKDFDAIGLKIHLTAGHCDKYNQTPMTD